MSDGNRSEAHIFPNAIGGRLKPKDILCRTCNSILGRAVDDAIVKAFGGLLTLVDVPRDRGKNPAVQLETRSGRRVRVEPDGRITQTDIVYNVSIENGRDIVEIKAPTMKLARQLLNRAKKDHPSIDVDALMAGASTESVQLEDELEVRLQFSPLALFGGVMTSLWLFFAHKTGHSNDDLNSMLGRLNAMQSHGGMFRYFPAEFPGLSGPETGTANKIVLRVVPSTGELIGYMELLGTFRIGGIYGSTGAPAAPLEYIYVHDPFTGQDLSSSFSIDSSVFDQVNWRTVGLGPTGTDLAQLKAEMRVAANGLINQYYGRFP